MGFWAWLKGKMSTGKTVEVTADTIEQFVDQERLSNLVAEELTIHAAINLIANSISKCEFKTLSKGKEQQGEEYYAWNYEPNKNQNSSQFLQELVATLLYRNECLVVESMGQLIIAESFTKEEYALKETVFSKRDLYGLRQNYYGSGYLHADSQHVHVCVRRCENAAEVCG